MLKKLLLSLGIGLLLANILTPALDFVSRVEADESIRIMADGSIQGTDRIQASENGTYLLLGDINGSIVVEKDFIVVDGAGFTLQSNGTGTGVSLTQRTSVAVQNLWITGFDCGISIDQCTNCTLRRNNIDKNSVGVRVLRGSSNSEISANNITANGRGISTDGFTTLEDSYKIYWIYHNNFVDNSAPRLSTLGWVGTIYWNLGYPVGGNYWSEYDGIDSKRGPYQNESGSDGVGDSPYSYAVQGHMGSVETMLTDFYPLTVPVGSNLPLAFPTARFTYAPSEPLVNETVEFNASTSTCVNGTIAYFNWDFGDGKTDNGPTVSHVYETQGNYNVTLTVISNTFIPETVCQSVAVSRMPAWQAWAVLAATSSLLAVVAIGLVLGLRRGRRKKAYIQTKLVPST